MGELLRDFLNAILTIIGASSLTDEEFDSLTLVQAWFDVETYEALLSIIDSREVVSNTRDRLTYYFLARGVEVSEPSAGVTKIYVGDEL